MRIKLKELLNVTEFAPQPAQSAPVPAQTAPTSAPTTPEPVGPVPASTAPTPEDPSEYDFTRDFRAFEDTKNQAEAAAKKKLLDKMNKMMLGKKIVANASRGYGQPKTDYTLEKVKKVSVEFWYKDWVVIVSDENDKKFFLTPGINIKIEGGAGQVEPGAAPGTEEPADQEAPNEPPKQAEPAAPEPAAPEAPPTDATGNTPPPEAAAKPSTPATRTTPEPKVPAAPATPEQPAQPQDPLKKKKKLVPVAEIIKELLNQCISESYKDRVDLQKFFENSNVNNTYVVEIPSKYFDSFDTRDFMLEAKDFTRYYDKKGVNSSVDVQSVGRVYRFTFKTEI